jgi:CheY-like chemotaxis protein
MGRLATGPVVLVIDDEPEICRLFSRVLEGGGFSCLDADSAERAWSLLEQGLIPSAILLDLWMPGAGGLAFLLRLRADPRYASIPVAIVTGDRNLNRMTETTLAALSATVEFKPLQIDTLLALIHTLMVAPGRTRPGDDAQR